MRNTLRKYIGKRIEFRGKISSKTKKKNDIPGRPIGHPKTGRKFDYSVNDYPKYKDNVILSEREPFLGAISPIRFPEDATCIVKVEGINGFEDICEDHVNIQEDLLKLWDLEPDSEVRLSAVVAEYKKGNGNDCCLIDIERLA